MSVKQSLYNLLVNRSPEIRDTYCRLSARASSGRERFGAYAALAAMNAVRLAGGDNPGRIGMRIGAASWFTGGKAGRGAGEFPRQLAGRLAGYDEISFDVFDTLILRRTKEPSEVFRMVGEALGYPDFVRLRREGERRAREKKEKWTGRAEVTLGEIWQELECETGISAEEGMRAELETESAVCYANPYMKQVTEYLVSQGRGYFVTSDMYLEEETIRGLLEQCGYEGIEGYYISCEIGLSKSGGELFDYVRSVRGWERRYIHVGDNQSSDVRNAARHGWASVHYRREEDGEGDGDNDTVL